ncbi:MAG TPA: hypothetical protein VFH55_10535 [Nitrospiria bacterium]|nr:hypothetical protein [Nitrospiria bacterium]
MKKLQHVVTLYIDPAWRWLYRELGASRRFWAVRWGAGWNIVIAWVLTLSAGGIIAWSIMKILAEFR